jgi:hypothetical protein
MRQSAAALRGLAAVSEKILAAIINKKSLVYKNVFNYFVCPNGGLQVRIHERYNVS